MIGGKLLFFSCDDDLACARGWLTVSFFVFLKNYYFLMKPAYEISVPVNLCGLLLPSRPPGFMYL